VLVERVPAETNFATNGLAIMLLKKGCDLFLLNSKQIKGTG